MAQLSFPPHCAPRGKVPKPNNRPFHRNQAHFLFVPEWQVSVLHQPKELSERDNRLLQRATEVT